MNGGKNKHPPGYTIVELMIVLAITSFMFVIAATFINGKQAKTSFTEGTHEMTSNIQNLIEQVTDGKYSDIPIYCTASGGSPPSLSISPNPPGSADCTFLGKFVHFLALGSTGANKYEIFTLAGAREVNSGPPVNINLDGLQAVRNPELTAQATIPQNLQVYDVKANGIRVFGLGFFQSLGNVSSGTYTSGAQTVSMYYTTNLNSLTNTEATAAPNLKNFMPTNNALICLTDGTRYAEIDLGSSNGNPLSAQLEVTSTC